MANKPRKSDPHKNRGLKLPEDAQYQMQLFLAAHLTMAEEGVSAARETLRQYPGLPSAVGQVAYWEGIVSAIKWLAARVPQRQKYLLELSKMEEGKRE